MMMILNGKVSSNWLWSPWVQSCFLPFFLTGHLNIICFKVIVILYLKHEQFETFLLDISYSYKYNGLAFQPTNKVGMSLVTKHFCVLLELGHYSTLQAAVSSNEQQVFEIWIARTHRDSRVQIKVSSAQQRYSISHHIHGHL